MKAFATFSTCFQNLLSCISFCPMFNLMVTQTEYFCNVKVAACRAVQNFCSMKIFGLYRIITCRGSMHTYIMHFDHVRIMCTLFSSLIKMLYWMCDKSDNPPTWPQLEHAIKRNFGGLESTELDPVKIFMDKLPCRREPPDLSNVPEEVS